MTIHGATDENGGYAPETDNEYKGYRITYFDTKYFALPIDAGIFEIARFRNNEYTDVVITHTLDEARREIDLALQLRLSFEAGASTNAAKREKALLLGLLSAEALEAAIDRLKAEYELTVLMAEGSPIIADGFAVIRYPCDGRLKSLDLAAMPEEFMDKLKGFDAVICPYDNAEFWTDSHVERRASQLTNRYVIAHKDGSKRLYKGEEVHRILYNKSYLNSMFRYVPKLKGKTILEVGCSDGLVCDLLLNEDPVAVTGVDLLETIGCSYPDQRIRYLRMDACALEFDDASFDLTLSIATLEHCKDPFKALSEMKRVTKKGGYCYVQAGPLYCSPFGHHMFGYYDVFPWIHLRMSKEEIIAYSESKGIGTAIMKNLSVSAEQYVNAMINPGHVNGLRLSDYRLSEFMRSDDCLFIRYIPSFEGKDLLTEEIAEELADIPPQDLTAHGFELLFQVR
ncbi:MAG: class I SAM-dependent methyltransferase [Deltaproteobacteria bacterium]|nr:class I SAM-dependent methyltransferase [Deltaproteobacteria bacterium]